MNNKIIAIGAAALVVITSGTILGIRASMDHQYKKGFGKGVESAEEKAEIKNNAVEDYKKNRVLFPKKGS